MTLIETLNISFMSAAVVWALWVNLKLGQIQGEIRSIKSRVEDLCRRKE